MASSETGVARFSLVYGEYFRFLVDLLLLSISETK